MSTKSRWDEQKPGETPVLHLLASDVLGCSAKIQVHLFYILRGQTELFIVPRVHWSERCDFCNKLITEPEHQPASSKEYALHIWVCDNCIWVFHVTCTYSDALDGSRPCDQGVRAWKRFFKPACFNINVTSIINRDAEPLHRRNHKN